MIRPIITHNDCIINKSAGKGKTLVYLMAINKIKRELKEVQIVVVVPTKILAI